MSEESPIDEPEFGEDPESLPDDLEDLDDDEREALQQDLLDVKTLKSVLGSRGIKGVVVWCPDCEDDHFLGWDLLAGNLEQILSRGKPPVHEPAWEPDPDEYVSWDYARGFLDGYENSEQPEGSGLCAYCGNDLPEGGYEWAYCPTCGSDLAPINLIHELKRQGWSGQQITDLFEATGLEPPLLHPDEFE